MKVAELRKLSTDELAGKSTDLRDEISQLKRRVRTGEVSNPRQVRGKRKDLARVLTVLGEQLRKEAQ